MNNKLSLFLFLTIFSSIYFSACKSRKNNLSVRTTLPDSNAVGIDSVFNIEQLRDSFLQFSKKNIDLKYLSSKAKIEVKTSDGNSFNLTFNFRIQKGKRIWSSISALGGIEVARVLIDRDSIKILDRFNNKYIKNDFNYLSKLVGMQLNFDLLEALLLNNFIAMEPFELNKISEKENRFLILNNNLVVSQFQLLDSNSKKINQYNFNNSLTQEDFQINYSDFRSFENTIYPYKFTIVSTSQGKTMNLNGEYIKFQKEENLEFPFNIPQKFN